MMAILCVFATVVCLVSLALHVIIAGLVGKTALELEKLCTRAGEIESRLETRRADADARVPIKLEGHDVESRP